MNDHDLFQMSGSTCMDISILGASLVWFLTGISMEQVELDMKIFTIISSFFLQLNSGKHLVWRLLCDWLCPHLDCTLVSIKCGRLWRSSTNFTNFKQKGEPRESSLGSLHNFCRCMDCYLPCRLSVKFKTFRVWRRMVLEDWRQHYPAAIGGLFVRYDTYCFKWDCCSTAN